MPCRSLGPHPGGLQAHTQGVSRPTPGWEGLQAYTRGGGGGGGYSGSTERPTAAGDTHPTGMHSCISLGINKNNYRKYDVMCSEEVCSIKGPYLSSANNVPNTQKYTF